MTEHLLACLEAHANHRGVVLATEETVLRETGAGRDEVAAELAKLERSGLIEILAPLPFLVARLRATWPGSRTRPSKLAAKSAAPPAHAHSYSKQLLQSKQLKESYRQPGETDPLLREILDTLGETDPASFEKAVELYAPHVIRTALDRVRRAQGIRKSRTALFRHLLPRIARENQRAA